MPLNCHSSVYGDVAAIKKKRTSMEMKYICSSEEPTQHILVEGSPENRKDSVVMGSLPVQYKIFALVVF